MNVTFETTEDSEATFTVQLEWNEILKEYNKVLNGYIQKAKVPGFRPGHAPKSMIERMYNKNLLLSEAVETLAEKVAVQKAIDSDVTILTHAHFHTEMVDEGKDVTLTGTFPVLSKGVLGDYNDIRISIPDVIVSDEEVDQVIDSYLKERPIFKALDRPAQIGDSVTVGMTYIVNEKTVGDLDQDQQFELLENRTGLFAGIDAFLSGMSEGDTKEFETTLPDDYPSESFAGKTVHFTVNMRQVSVKEYLVIDDNFAKQEAGVDTVEEMRNSIRSNQYFQKLQSMERNLQNDLIDQLVAKLELSVPKELIETELNDMMQDMAELIGQSMPLADYLKMIGKDENTYREELRPDAIRRIKQRRALSLVADRENITVTAQDIQNVVNEYNQSKPGQHVRASQLSNNQRIVIVNRLRNDEALKLLMRKCYVYEKVENSDSSASEPAEDALQEQNKQIEEDTLASEPVTDDTIS